MPSSTFNCLKNGEQELFLTTAICLFEEKQRNDTIFPGAGIPIYAGDRYYGIHLVHPVDADSFIRLAVNGLAEAATFIKADIQKRSRRKAPEYILGVTHLRLATLAMHAHFTCVEIPESAFFEKQNVAVGWDKFQKEINRYYTQDTELAARGVPIRYGVVSQTVAQFIEKWHPDNLTGWRRAAAQI